MPSPFKPVTVELSKEKGWNWNYPDQQDRIADLTKDVLEELDTATVVWFVRSLIGVLRVRTRRGPKEWSPRGIVTDHDVRMFARDLIERFDELPDTTNLLHEVVSVMVEAAVMPSHEDLVAVFSKTRDALEHTYRVDADLWAPILDGFERERPWTKEHVARALGNSVYVRNAPTEYNYTLLFALGNAYPVGLVFRAAQLPRAEIIERMNREFERYRKAYVRAFLEELDVHMDRIDIKSRMDYESAWRWVVHETDKKQVQAEVEAWFRS